MSSLTEVNGLFSNCGPGIDNYEISYSCRGPSCSSITGFQDISCDPSTNDEPGVDFTCSNGFQCPQGVSSYQSNFTFSQNAPDTIDPPPNDVDSRVHQHQDVIIPDCRKFSVDSDGTKEGTSTSDVETEPDCGIAVQSTSTPSSSDLNLPTSIKSATNPKPSTSSNVEIISNSNAATSLNAATNSNAATSLNAATSSNVATSLSLATSSTVATSTIDSFEPSPTPSIGQFTGSATRQRPRRQSLFFAFLFGFILFMPGAQAQNSQRDDELHSRARLRVRATSDEVRRFALQFDATLAEKANAVGEDGNTFAHNLVADIITSVCGSFFRGEDVGAFAPKIVGDCVKTIYGGERLPEPGVQFLAVFGGSLLCDYAVSEAFPIAKEFSADGCRGLEDLASRIGPSGTIIPSNVPSETALPVSGLPLPTTGNLPVGTSTFPVSEPSAPSPSVPSAPAISAPATSPSATSPSATSPSATSPSASIPSLGTSDSVSTVVSSIESSSGSEASIGTLVLPLPGSSSSGPQSLISSGRTNSFTSPGPSDSFASSFPGVSSEPPTSITISTSLSPGLPSDSTAIGPSSTADALSEQPSSVTISTSLGPPPPSSTSSVDLTSDVLTLSSTSSTSIGSSDIVVTVTVTTGPSESSSVGTTSIISVSSTDQTITPTFTTNSSIISEPPTSEPPISRPPISRPPISRPPISNPPFSNSSSSSLPPSTVSGASTAISHSSGTTNSTTILLPSTSTNSSTVGSSPSVSSTSAPPSTPSCNPESSTPDFCPGFGCTSLSIDDSNCGACNFTCEWRCSDGKCTCPKGQVIDEDGRNCINITITEPPCPTNFTMDPILSSCTPIPDPGLNCSTSELGPDFCPGVGCTNLYADRFNCGSCNNTCEWRCSYGSCICPRDLSRRQDRKSCCDPGWAINFETNQCEPSCPEGWYFDVDVGGCQPIDGGNATTVTITITSSTTATAPNSTFTGPTSTPTPSACPLDNPDYCPGICDHLPPGGCLGHCVDLLSDLENCGTCGSPCTGNMTCQSGECARPVGSFILEALGG